MADVANTLCVPGDRLGNTSEYLAGQGTHVNGRFIYACVVGAQRMLPAPDGAADKRPTVEVIRGQQRLVPSPGSEVTVKITKVSARFASAEILCLGRAALPPAESFSGMIRLQDVRATEIDKVDLFKCFRPNDIVKADVLSLGDARSYYLSTARNELGVVFARSLAGFPMVPISWEEMQCPVTLVKERRKVAKVAVAAADT
eukprot:jgi/Mesvir1/17102/Mv07537-RA.1